MRLTDDAIRRAKRPRTGQDFAWDTLVSGFGIRYTPTCTAFVVQWREPGGIKRRETLKPRWPQLPVSQAREMARKRLGEVVARQDSGGSAALRSAIRVWYERQTELGSWRPRFRQKVDSLISAYVEGQERARIKLSPKARAAVESLGLKPIAGVTRADVMQLADALKPGVAESVLAILSMYFNSAYERGQVTGNPAKNRLKVTGGRSVRHRRLSEPEFLALWRAFEAEGDPAFAAFQVLAYSGCRRREVTGMRHDVLDLDAGTWTLPPERRKTGRSDPEDFVIALHPAAVKVLRRQPVLEGSPYVFWGRRDKKNFDFGYLLMKRVRAAVPVKDWRLHDIRRFVRTELAKLGITQTVAELTLGHSAKTGLVMVYDAHDYQNEKAAAWRKWGNHLVKLTAGN